MKNRVYQKQIINGQEQMILIEEYETDTLVEVQPSVEELQSKIEVLQIQLTEVQQQLEQISNSDSGNIIF